MTRSARAPSSARSLVRPRVVIAGAGIAGLEALVALHALAADRLDITLLAPGLTFVNRPRATCEPFAVPHEPRLRLADIARDLGARWQRAVIDRVEPDRHRVVTGDGAELGYDWLVLAVGARTARPWQSAGVLTFDGAPDHGADSVPVLLHHLRAGQIKQLAFVKPTGVTWPSPLYDLALLTAAHCGAHGLREVEMTLVTPEPRPLLTFGTAVSVEIQQRLDNAEVTLVTSSRGSPCGREWLDISPGDRGMPVDQIVTQPRLLGPRLRGIPCGHDGFIRTDSHGRVVGIADVYAAGDATEAALKHGGVAAQQADAVAATIACAAGVDIDPRPFSPNRSCDELGTMHDDALPSSPCSDLIAHDPHAIDILLEHVALGSWRTCLGLAVRCGRA